MASYFRRIAQQRAQKFYFILTLLCVSYASNCSAKVVEIEIVAEQFPPLQSQQQSSKSGYVHLLMQEALRRVEYTYPVKVKSYEFLPWRRALLKAQNSPNVLFYSLSRTPDRELKYQWLAEVSVYHQSLYKLKENKIDLASFEHLKKSSTALSVQSGSALQSYLENLGLNRNKDFRTYIKYQQGIKQLFKGRIDLMPLNDLTAKQSACKLGLDGTKLTAVLKISALSRPLWAVFSKETDPALVDKFRQAIAQIQQEGMDDIYFKKSMSAWNDQPCIQNS